MKQLLNATTAGRVPYGAGGVVGSLRDAGGIRHGLISPCCFVREGRDMAGFSGLSGRCGFAHWRKPLPLFSRSGFRVLFL